MDHAPIFRASGQAFPSHEMVRQAVGKHAAALDHACQHHGGKSSTICNAQADFYGLPGLREQVGAHLAGAGARQDGSDLLASTSPALDQYEWHAVVVTGDTDMPNDAAPRLLQVNFRGNFSLLQLAILAPTCVQDCSTQLCCCMAQA